MRQEKSSWEEVIKIQLSSKIIKRENASLGNTIPIAETEFEFIEEENLIEEPSHDMEKGVEIDLAKIKADIKESLYLEIEEERKRILNDAQIEVDKIKLESRKQGYNAGYKEGYKVGYSEGLDKSKEEGQIIKERALNLIKQSEDYVDQYLEENEAKIIELSVDMAEAIVHSTIDSSSENILMLVKPILQGYEKKDSIIITCHPNNYSHLKDQLHQLKELSPDTRFIVLEDENLEKNGCIIENEHQVIDLQIQKQIYAILEEIKNLE